MKNSQNKREKIKKNTYKRKLLNYFRGIEKTSSEITEEIWVLYEF